MSSQVRTLLLAAALAGCAPQPARLAVSAGSSGRAISLLGDTLWNTPVDPRDGPRLMAQLQLARSMVSADTTDLDAQLRLARQTAAAGQLTDAVERLNRIARVHWLSPRVYRYRGEFLLRLRELDQALGDFETAEEMLRVRPLKGPGPGPSGMIIEYEEGADSAAVVSSVQFQIPFHKGLIRYLQNEPRLAQDQFTTAAVQASNDDDLAQAALWLFFAVRRTGDIATATEILAAVDTTWEVTRNRPEYQLLLGFKGLVPTDTIRARALDGRRGAERSLYAYGIAFTLLATDRPDEATLWLDQARSIPQWTELAYLAAEADLARLRRRDRGRS